MSEIYYEVVDYPYTLEVAGQDVEIDLSLDICLDAYDLLSYYISDSDIREYAVDELDLSEITAGAVIDNFDELYEEVIEEGCDDGLKEVFGHLLDEKPHLVYEILSEHRVFDKLLEIIPDKDIIEYADSIESKEIDLVEGAGELTGEIIKFDVVCVSPWDGFTVGKTYEFPYPVDDEGCLRDSIEIFLDWSDIFEKVEEVEPVEEAPAVDILAPEVTEPLKQSFVNEVSELNSSLDFELRPSNEVADADKDEVNKLNSVDWIELRPDSVDKDKFYTGCVGNFGLPVGTKLRYVDDDCESDITWEIVNDGGVIKASPSHLPTLKTLVLSLNYKVVS